MSKNTIYIAGPMRGYPRFNFDAFMEAEARLKEQGWHVLNPAAVDLSEGFDPDTAVVTSEMMAIFIKRDLEMVQQADAIALLPLYQDSAGATAELALAVWRGIPVYNYFKGTLHPHELYEYKLGQPKAAKQPLTPVIRNTDAEMNGASPETEPFRRISDYQGLSAIIEPADEDILEEALRITRGDRQAQYGPPDQDFQRTARMWSALKGVEFSAHDVAMFMILLKCSRQTHQHKRDNWVDIAGYARCGSLIAN